MEGFVKIHRKIVDWEWYKDIPTRLLFEHLIYISNHKEKKWQGNVIERGSCVTSIASLSFQTGLTPQQVRTALKKLQSTNDITKLSNNKNTVIIITNYNKYQDVQQANQQTNNNQDNKQSTNNQQTNNKQITTNKNDKNDKNDNNDKNIKKVKHTFGTYKHVRLTQDEYIRLQHDFPYYQQLIEKLDEYLEINNKSYKNHNLVLRGWVLKWYKENHDYENFEQPLDNPVTDTNEFDDLLDQLKRGEL